jgi:hypothetical protein
MTVTQHLPSPQSTFDRLMMAVRANDRSAFIVGATHDMEQAVTPELMMTIHHELTPHINSGYEATFLCDLNQQGFTVHLWKVCFADGTDDIVLRIVLDGDKLAGFFRQ